MIKLNETEARVYELLKQKKTVKEIASVIGRDGNYIKLILKYLVNQGLAEKKSSYTAVKGSYELISKEESSKPKISRLRILKILIRKLGKDNLRFLINHHGILMRRQIAERLRISKFELNHIYILLGMKGKDSIAMAG